MGPIIKLAGLASIAALISMSSAYAAQDRMASVEECVAKAKSEVADAKTPNDSSVQRARTQIYSACMKKKGLRP